MPRQDPRLNNPADSVNEQLLDRTVRHLLYLTRLQTQEANQITDALEEVLPSILDRLRNADLDSGGIILTANQKQRLQQLSTEVGAIIDRQLATIEQDTAKRLLDLANHETEFEYKLLDRTVPITWDFQSPSLQALRSAVLNNPFSGDDFKGWFKRLNSKYHDTIMQAVRTGIVEGETVYDIAKRIEGTKALNFKDGDFRKIRNSAKKLARSAVMHTVSMARQRFYQDNADIVKGEIWVNTLDTRTCRQCVAYAQEGKPYKVGEGPISPAHINCRCIRTAYLKSYRELGIDLDEVPASKRAAMGGEAPAEMTYNQWLKKQSAKIQDEALGPTLGKAYRKGEFQVGDFVDRNGKPWTLDEIRAREGDIFGEAA